MKRDFIKLFMVLCLITNATYAQNLIQNGGFGSGSPTPFCDSIPYQWTSSVHNPPYYSITGVELDTIENGGNFWVDMSSCYYYGNNQWIEQTINTTIGETYLLSFDLGSWNDYEKIAAGVYLFIDGSYVNNFQSDDFSGNHLMWHRKYVCFTATRTNTVIHFQSAPTTTASSPGYVYATNYTSPYSHFTRVVGIDNVRVQSSSNLIINGRFDQFGPPSGGYLGFCHTMPPPWNASTFYYGSGDMQWTDIGQPGNPWVDMTDCDWDNTRWIEQTVHTIPGLSYTLTYDLGAYTYEDAGVDITITGQPPIYRIALRGTLPLNWSTFNHTFTATSSSTTIRFTCNAPNGVGMNMTVPVVGLDNVSLTGNVCANINSNGEIPGDGQTRAGGTNNDEDSDDTSSGGGNGGGGNEGGGQGKMGANSISNTNVASNIILTPNPAKDEFTISGIKTKGTVIMVYDLTGKLLIKKEVDDNKSSVKIHSADLATGVYIVTVKERDKVSKVKLVKE